VPELRPGSGIKSQERSLGRSRKQNTPACREHTWREIVLHQVVLPPGLARLGVNSHNSLAVGELAGCSGRRRGKSASTAGVLAPRLVGGGAVSEPPAAIVVNDIQQSSQRTVRGCLKTRAASQ